MVKFSQTLDDRQSKNKEKPYEQVRASNQYYYERQPQVQMRDDRLYSQPPRPAYQEPAYQQPDNVYVPAKEEPSDIIYKRETYEDKSIQPDYSKPELQFPPDQNIQFGVEYSPNSRPPVIGKNYTIISSAKKIIKEEDFLNDYFALTKTYQEKPILNHCIEYKFDKKLDVKKIEQNTIKTKDFLKDNI